MFCQPLTIDRIKNPNECHTKPINEYTAWRGWKRIRCLTWTCAHGVPLHTLSKGEGSHVGVGVDTLLHVAAPHTLWAAAGALAAGGSHGTRCPALLGTVVGWGTFLKRLCSTPLEYECMNIMELKRKKKNLLQCYSWTMINKVLRHLESNNWCKNTFSKLHNEDYLVTLKRHHSTPSLTGISPHHSNRDAWWHQRVRHFCFPTAGLKRQVLTLLSFFFFSWMPLSPSATLCCMWWKARIYNLVSVQSAIWHKCS